MEVVILEDAEEVGRAGADAVAQHVETDPEAVLGLATGSSPLRIYRELAARVRRGELSLARCRAFLLDEYVGLPADHPESYRNVIMRELVDHVDIDPDNVRVPDGLASDIDEECAGYEQAIADAGGVDVQLLGIGTTGHIAFNEPGSSLVSRTRIKTLIAQTRRDNARFFDGDVDAVPRHVITQGLGTILGAEHLVLVATGEGKAAAIAAAVEGPLTASCPGSVLQLHPHVTLVVDEEAGSRLARADHYRYVLRHKIPEQGW